MMMMDGGRRLFDRDEVKPKKVGETIKRFVHYFRHYWHTLTLVAIFVIATAWTAVTVPDLIGQAVDCYLFPQAVRVDACWYTEVPSEWLVPDPSAEVIGERLAGVTGLVLKVAGLFVLESVLTGLSFHTLRWSAQNVIRRIQRDLFRHLHRLSIGYYSRNEVGDIMSRVTNDVDTVQQTFNFALLNVVRGTLTVSWIVVRMLQSNVPYALLSLAILPLMLITTNYFSGQARKAFRKARSSLGSVNADLQESIAGAREVQAFNREEETIAQFEQSNAANMQANIRAALFTSALSPVLEALGYLSLGIVVVVGGLALLGEISFLGVVTLGTVFAFVGYVQRANQPIQQIAILWTNVQSGIAGGERIFALMDSTVDVVDAPDAQTMPPIQGRVAFEGVEAEYVAGEKVLKGVDLVAEPGQTVAIVGPTGAGKTTIINLIPRFYDVTGGRVLIDGHDVRSVTQDSLRQQIGIVLQDTFLFSDTVLENIRYGRLDATDEEVKAAARMVAADEFIQRLPDGYATVLGERGGGLSQGQRQLIAIARVALMNPAILILDEATSSVDTRTERIIQAAFDKLLEGRTSFVIAHRLSTIRNADVILMLKDGEIVERGTHRELLARQGEYYHLYMSQFGEEEAAPSAGSNGAMTPQPAGD